MLTGKQFLRSAMRGVVAIASIGFALNAGADVNPKAAACMGCHGADGNSPTDMWPKLAGQLPEYMKKQIHDFKSGARKNEQMSPMAQSLAEADIGEVADYFAKQAVKPSEGKKELLATGEQLYLKGKGRPDVIAACVGCHGQSGAGRSDWKELMSNQPVLLAPAIGGQHPGYIARQLLAYKNGARSNDPASVMRGIAARMTDEEIQAVAEYTGTLKR